MDSFYEEIQKTELLPWVVFDLIRGLYELKLEDVESLYLVDDQSDLNLLDMRNFILAKIPHINNNIIYNYEKISMKQMHVDKVETWFWTIVKRIPLDVYENFIIFSLYSKSLLKENVRTMASELICFTNLAKFFDYLNILTKTKLNIKAVKSIFKQVLYSEFVEFLNSPFQVSKPFKHTVLLDARTRNKLINLVLNANEDVPSIKSIALGDEIRTEIETFIKNEVVFHIDDLMYKILNSNIPNIEPTNAIIYNVCMNLYEVGTSKKFNEKNVQVENIMALPKNIINTFLLILFKIKEDKIKTTFYTDMITIVNNINTKNQENFMNLTKSLNVNNIRRKRALTQDE